MSFEEGSSSVVVLEEVISDLQGSLFRDGEVAQTPRTRGFFTWRSKGKKEGEQEPDKKKTHRGRGAKSFPDAGVPLQPLVVEERFSQHKGPILDVVSVKSENNPELWSIDDQGVVCRWPVAPAEKGGRSVIAKFNVGSSAKRTISFCAQNVWIGGHADNTLVYSTAGKLVTKVLEFSNVIIENNAGDGAWLGGKDGVVSLYKLDVLSTRIQLKERSLVDTLCRVFNSSVADDHELWITQGNSISVASESSTQVLQELNGVLESKALSTCTFETSLWVGCEDGKLYRFSVAQRAALVSLQAVQGPCLCLALGGGRLFAGGADKSLRIFDLETGSISDGIVRAHDDAVSALEFIEHQGKLNLWSGGRDKAVVVWTISPAIVKKKSLVSVSSKEESDDVDDSTSEMSSDRAASADLAKSPRFPVAPNISPAPLGMSSPSKDKEEEYEDDDGAPDDENPSSLRSSKRKIKKRVLSKLLSAVQAGSCERMKVAMQSVEDKHETPEGKAEARAKALDRRGPNRRTALHLAAQAGNLECVQLLLDWGANIAAKDKYDMFPINLTNATDVKALLLQHHAAQGIDANLGKTASPNGKHVRAKSSAAAIGGKKIHRKKVGSTSRRPDVSPRTSIVLDMVSPRGEEVPSSEPVQLSSEAKAAIVIQKYARMRLAKAESERLKSVRVKRKNIVLEMLKTEETYVKTLDVLVNKIRVTMSTQSFRAATGVLTDQDTKVIFPSSLSMLLNAHQSWLEQLRQRQQNWTPHECVGDLYLQLSPYLKMYIVYVSNFELSTLKIREVKKREKSKFGEVVQELFVNLGDPSNDLASMLVTPVQRIPRYVLMLKDLLKHTSTQHPDYNNLLKAVKIMTDTTVLVDRKAEDAKNAQKVLEVADNIVDSPAPIVQPNRKWVKDGPLGVFVSVGDVRPRFVFLFTDVLVLCQGVEPATPKSKKKDEEPPKVNQFRYQREVSLLAATVHIVKDEEGFANGLLIKSPKISVILQASSANERSSWIKAIVNVIDMRKEGNMTRMAASLKGSGDTLRSSGESPLMIPLSARSGSISKGELDDDTQADASTSGLGVSGGKSSEGDSVSK